MNANRWDVPPDLCEHEENCDEASHDPGCDSGIIPWEAWQVQAGVCLQGAPLHAGDFRFLLQDQVGRIAARGRNDASGCVHFEFCIPPWPKDVSRRFSMRQQPSSCIQQQIRYDPTCYSVELCPQGNVVYRKNRCPVRGIPVFTNTVARTGHSILGTVHDTCGCGLAGWRIELRREPDREQCPPWKVTATDVKGHYCFERLPTGRYVITAGTRPGWQALGCTRYVLYVSQVEATGIDFIFQSRCHCPYDRELYPT